MLLLNALRAPNGPFHTSDEASTPLRLQALADGAPEHHAMTTLQVYAAGSLELLLRPCVDSGKITDCFCNLGKAEERMPEDEWEAGQRTPLCPNCDAARGGLCHYCRGQQWCVPPNPQVS